ncbi:endonuclease/exonuclease/phosphatase family protein [Micromonospora humi]|uniref:Metal-dependent hydrolase, endonuclease/exonuclease/phosphatase family n=1 Tax=Micromonospora humi TaxID=745366 RepID=A0A1C5IWP2_9ACTN|nr:endonuclease/exonuclease/phosphatase family protein [Micromonospora humi]SCG62750.1 Metal-dependent hydrolase, endonuclease/exonuclease/phosphatase family [Micromonospora humi]
MRHRHLSTLTLALGVAVLLDVLRVWLPSVITLFGRAAETPAELLGAFALGWFVLALGAPALVRRLGARPVGLAAAGVLAAVRLALTAAPGGPTQLWLACAGLLAGLVWLASVAASVDRPVPGLALGLAGNAVGHALLGTEDLVWRGGTLGWTLSAALVAAFLVAAVADRPGGPAAPPAVADRPAQPIAPSTDPAPADPAPVDSAPVDSAPVDSAPADAAPVSPVGSAPSAEVAGSVPSPISAGGRRAWLLCGPALLLANQIALAPAVWSAAAGVGPSGFPGLARPGGGTVLGAYAVGLFLGGALYRPPVRLARVVWPVALFAGAVLFAAGRLGPAYLVTAAGLGGCLALTDTDEPGRGGVDGRAAARRGRAAVAGMLVFAVATIVYYAAYDLGYPNGWVPVATAVLVVLVALGAPSWSAPTLSDPVRNWLLVSLAGLTGLGMQSHVPSTTPPIAGRPSAVRVTTYNIRMGFGLDGRLDLDAVARQLRGSDVVLLSEVDRGWWLNGGHDTLALLAGRLRMPYVFAPAADPVWGDAVLSRFPARSGRTRPLAAHGAPTGAQALGVTLDLGGRDLAVVATHLQPPPGRDPVEQAREVAEFAAGYAAGRPLVLGGDLNTEPGAPAFAEFARVGLVDALAAARPLRTSPADDPRTEIDHVFVSPGLTAAEVRAPRTEASDHLPVRLTVALPDPPSR